MTERRDFRWLVRQRSRNQKFLLELCSFERKCADELARDRRARTVFHLLVGAGFSLWRAVFLADPETSVHVLSKHAREFLETLIADNTITYTEDKNRRTWTAGYYLNNAYYRVQEAINAIAKESKAIRSQEAIRRFCKSRRRSMVSTNRHHAWEHAHNAAALVLTRLKARLRARGSASRDKAPKKRVQPPNLARRGMAGWKPRSRVVRG